MSIQKIYITEFLKLAAIYPVLDVRSPSEYQHAHIPNAISFPLFTNDERKIVGTSYKQESKQNAIKIGLDYFGPKMRLMVENAEQIINTHFNNHRHLNNKSVLVHCWRGGMRSGAVAWLLNLFGYDVFLLDAGYKSYRNLVLKQFEKVYQFKIIGGFAGSGKTKILHNLLDDKFAVLNLEAIANHKGSALGAIGQDAQPSQEMFENLLAASLISNCNSTKHDFIFIEDESQRIGNLQIPNALWLQMRNSKVYFLDIPFNERLNYITEEYGIHPKEQLANAIMRIQKKLGGLESKNAINFLNDDNFKDCFSILLKYYDKSYSIAMLKRKNHQTQIKNILSNLVDAEQNKNLLIQNLD